MQCNITVIVLVTSLAVFLTRSKDIDDNENSKSWCIDTKFVLMLPAGRAEKMQQNSDLSSAAWSKTGLASRCYACAHYTPNRKLKEKCSCKAKLL